jgi:hypothetical protein
MSPIPGAGTVRVLVSLVTHFSRRTKFTAHANVKDLVSRKAVVNASPYPKVANVNVAKHTVDHLRDLNRQRAEADHQEDMFAYQDLATLESQMESLKTKGFLRAYKPYSPPSDLTPRYLATCSQTLGVPVSLDTMETVSLDNIQDKVQVLKALQSEFGHTVHSSTK